MNNVGPDYHVRKELKDYKEREKEFLGQFYKSNKDKVLTMEVGKFSDGVSPYGCHDMAGNVWEWTSSKYDKERSVLRGGSWRSSSLECRCAYRNLRAPSHRNLGVGFRCARTLTL